MKKPQNFLKAISLAMVVCSSILISTAESASAFGRMKKDFLGITTTRDNAHYVRSTGDKSARRNTLAPANRNRICRWKYPRTNGTVYGKPDGRWNTKCYHTYFKSS